MVLFKSLKSLGPIAVFNWARFQKPDEDMDCGKCTASSDFMRIDRARGTASLGKDGLDRMVWDQLEWAQHRGHISHPLAMALWEEWSE